MFEARYTKDREENGEDNTPSAIEAPALSSPANASALAPIVPPTPTSNPNTARVVRDDTADSGEAVSSRADIPIASSTPSPKAKARDDNALLPLWGPLGLLGEISMKGADTCGSTMFILDKSTNIHLIPSTVLHLPREQPYVIGQYDEMIGPILLSTPLRDKATAPWPAALIEVQKVHVLDMVIPFRSALAAKLLYERFKVLLSRRMLLESGWSVNDKTRVLSHVKSGVTFRLHSVDGEDAFWATAWWWADGSRLSHALLSC